MFSLSRVISVMVKESRNYENFVCVYNINGFHYGNYHFGVGSLVETAAKNEHEVSVKVLLTKDEYSAQEIIGFGFRSSLNEQNSPITPVSLVFLMD